MRLLDHWRAVIPLSLLEVKYESLVTDFEPQARRMIEFLGLEWDPACLNYDKTERPVLTASRWQVRQPIYTSSIGRWRHYQHHLRPLIEGLGSLIE
jgi:hypothetical protein